MVLFVVLYQEDKHVLCVDHVCPSICDTNVSEDMDRTFLKMTLKNGTKFSWEIPIFD